MVRTHALWIVATLSLVACTPRTKRGPVASTAAAPSTATSPTTPATATTASSATPAGAWPTAAPTASQAATKPLLAPLVGVDARRAEVRAVLLELVAQLSPTQAAKVSTIPLRFDPDANDVNAFAGCEKGAPYLAATEGFLLAIDAIAQTRATDELFGTKTYDTYAKDVAKRIDKPGGGGPGLPAGSIPSQYVDNAQRQSRAREIFGDVVAFAFGHELAHHYLGHTGCATGQATGSGPNPAVVGLVVTTIIPGLNQPTEIAADTAGCFNTLDAGKARRPNHAWSEQGGLWLFEFFGHLEGSSLLSSVGFLRTHPDSRLRGPIIKAAANAWRAEQPK